MCLLNCRLETILGLGFGKGVQEIRRNGGRVTFSAISVSGRMKGRREGQLNSDFQSG